MKKPWHEIFLYRGGVLYWKHDDTKPKPWNGAWPGKQAGSRGKRYMTVFYCGRAYLQHRIIYEMHCGPIPEGSEIDHINCNSFDNRIENLRLADRSQNMRNSRKRKDNTTGVKGVFRQRSKFRAQIQVRGKSRFLGMFQNLEDAADAYKRAALEAEEDFARF